MNSFAERRVRSVKEECLSKLILFWERSLRRALQQYVEHYNEERNRQGKENLILFPKQTEGVEERRSSAMSGAARRPAEVLRERGGVGVEVGTACHVWQFSHI